MGVIARTTHGLFPDQEITTESVHLVGGPQNGQTWITPVVGDRCVTHTWQTGVSNIYQREPEVRDHFAYVSVADRDTAKRYGWLALIPMGEIVDE